MVIEYNILLYEKNEEKVYYLQDFFNNLISISVDVPKLKINHKMRKLLFILLFILPVFTFAQTRVKVGNLYYNINGTTATVARNFFNSFTSDYRESLYEIPEQIYYNGVSYTVIGIDDFAFSAYKSETYGLSASSVRTVKIPKTVKTIGSSAFHECKNLRNVIFTGPDNSLTEIGSSAFNGCIALSSILVPAHVKKLGNGIFNNSYIQTIEYLGVNPPENWVAAKKTYVTSKHNYKSPKTSISDIYDIEELVSFTNVAFIYNANNVYTSWNANYEKNWECITMPKLEKDAGNYRINISFSFTPYYCNGSSTEKFYIEIPYFYTISPLKLTVTAQNAARIYGDNNPPFEVKYSGFINSENESVLSEKPVASTTATPNSNVGTYPITVSGGSAKNYTLNYKDGVLTVNKAPLSARVVDASRLYGAENPNFSLSYQGLKNNETEPKWTKAPVFISTATTSSGVGEYAVNATANPTNYTLTINPGILTVNPAPLVMKAEDATRKYYEDDPVFNYTCSGFVNNEDVSVITTQPSFSTQSDKTSDVGTYSLTLYGAVAANYAISYESGVLIITQRDLIVIAEDKSREYGDTNPQFTFVYQGFAGDDGESVLLSKPEALCTAQPSSNVGTYVIVSKGGSAKNYKIHNENGTLTIQKAPLTVYVNDCQKVYGSNNPTFSSRYEGLKNEETQPVWITTPTYTTEATRNSGVGVYVIKLVNGQCMNYDATFVDGNLTIIKAQLIVKVENISRLYYEENPEFSYQILGLCNTDDASVLTKKPNLECTALLTSKAGTYPINASGAEASNYEIGYEEGELTIMKRILTVIPNDVTRKYAEKNPELGCVISGFVNNEDNSILLQLPTIYTNASELSDVGSYAIYAKDAMADNYNFNYKQGTLTIEKANQTITWKQEFNDIAVGDQIELLAKSTSGLDIEYVFDTDIVSLYVAGEQQYLDCLADGTFSIRATQNGDKNYNPAVRVAKTITIGNSSGISAIIEESFSHPVYFDLLGKQIVSLPQKGIVIRIINGKQEKISINQK